MGSNEAVMTKHSVTLIVLSAAGRGIALTITLFFVTVASSSMERVTSGNETPCGLSHIMSNHTPILCFARKVCRFAMKGLPLGLHGTTSGFWKRSTSRDGRVTSYYPCIIMRPVIFQKRSIVTKVGRIVTKVGREKSVWQPKITKTPQNFTQFLTARVCFRCAITAKFSDNGRPTGGRCARPSAGAVMLCSLCIAGS